MDGRNCSPDTELLTDIDTASTLHGCVLFVTQGSDSDRGRHLLLRHGTAVVGTDPASDLRLTDPKVSRSHAEIEVTPKGISVRDLGSTNGTLILGNPIERVLVRHGAQLQVGKTHLAILPLQGAGGVEPDQTTRYGRLHGLSVPMRQLFTILRQLEDCEPPVLIVGETGTGKELVARTLHECGPRKDRPFTILDCGALPAGVIDSELFGHARGAFTGAVSEREGVFEVAHGGTLLLDEIGELPLELQPRLLRALETQTVRRIGENHPRSVDVRVLAATPPQPRGGDPTEHFP